MGLELYDTATGEVRPFVPRTPGEVGVYLCGATVQSPPHIGHIRSGVAFDVLRRWLERTSHVTFIRNVTDIDDKILARADASGQPWWSVAYTNERAFGQAYAALNVSPPTYEPRATGHIPEMVELIAELVDSGHAYPAGDGSGDVYFDVASWPQYGSLSHQRLADMEPAADADPRGKRDPRDFALWKGTKPGEPVTASWPTPWGRGRPGWHLECSAMARKYLGSAFDIHAGGLDLRFPHHENEQAQSRAAEDEFAAYWLHNGWVTMSGEKMSKSLGNGLLVSEMVQQVRAVELRYYLGAAHYRSAIEFSDRALSDAGAAYRRIEHFLGRATAALAGDGGAIPVRVGEVPPAFAAAMDDDLAVPAALGVLHETVREGNRVLDGGGDPGADLGGYPHRDPDRRRLDDLLAQVNGMLDVLGLLFVDSPADPASDVAERALAALDALVRSALEERAQARAAKQWAAADAARDRLAAAGVVVTDTAAGPRWELPLSGPSPASDIDAEVTDSTGADSSDADSSGADSTHADPTGPDGRSAGA